MIVVSRCHYCPPHLPPNGYLIQKDKVERRRGAQLNLGHKVNAFGLQKREFASPLFGVDLFARQFDAAVVERACGLLGVENLLQEIGGNRERRVRASEREFWPIENKVGMLKSGN